MRERRKGAGEKEGGSHEWDMRCRREDMLAQWGPPCAAVEKIDREEGNLRATVNSASRPSTLV